MSSTCGHCGRIRANQDDEVDGICRNCAKLALIKTKIRLALARDESQAQALHKGLAMRVASIAPANYAAVVAVITAAIRSLPKSVDPDETFALVLPKYFLAAQSQARPCGSDHPQVAKGLAQASDRYCGIMSSYNPKIIVLVDPQATRGCVRWIDPAGDRTIVVLPDEYNIL